MRGIGTGRSDAGWWIKLSRVGGWFESLRDARGSGWWVFGCVVMGVGRGQGGGGGPCDGAHRRGVS